MRKDSCNGRSVVSQEPFHLDPGLIYAPPIDAGDRDLAQDDMTRDIERERAFGQAGEDNAGTCPDMTKRLSEGRLTSGRFDYDVGGLVDPFLQVDGCVCPKLLREFEAVVGQISRGDGGRAVYLGSCDCKEADGAAAKD